MENKFVEKLKGERLELRINVPEIELAKKIFATVDENRDYLLNGFLGLILHRKLKIVLNFYLILKMELNLEIK